MPARFAFASPGRPIVLEVSAEDGQAANEGEALVAALGELLPEWPATPTADEPTIHVSRRQSRFTFRYPGLPDGEVAMVGLRLAAAALAAALTTSLAQQNDRWLQAHAAAIALPRGYLLLYGDSLAGKSSLASLASWLGAPVVSDDRLVVEVPIEGPPRAIALGASPRLRQPLPADFGAEFQAFAGARYGRAEGEVALLKLARPKEQLAAGERGPILALVALERRAGGSIELSPMGQGLALKRLYGAFAAPHLAAEAMTRRLHKLVRRVPAHSLVFARSRDAAKLLIERFGEGVMRYRRNPHVRATDVEGEFFLVEPQSGQIYYLDQVTSGLWRLLAEPLDRQELIETYREAFPEQSAEELAEAVNAALEEMLAGKLVAPAED